MTYGGFFSRRPQGQPQDPVSDPGVSSLDQITQALQAGQEIPAFPEAPSVQEAEATARGRVSFADQAIGLFQAVMSGVPGSGDTVLQMIREQEIAAREARLRAEHDALSLKLAKRGEAVQSEQERMRQRIAVEELKGRKEATEQRREEAQLGALGDVEKARLAAQAKTPENQLALFRIIGDASGRLQTRIQGIQSRYAPVDVLKVLDLPQAAQLGIMGALASDKKDALKNFLVEAYAASAEAQLAVARQLDPIRFGGMDETQQKQFAQKLGQELGSAVDAEASTIPEGPEKRDFIQKNLYALGVSNFADQAKQDLLNPNKPAPDATATAALTEQMATKALTLFREGKSWSEEDVQVLSAMRQKLGTSPDQMQQLDLGMTRATDQIAKELGQDPAELGARMTQAIKDAMDAGDSRASFLESIGVTGPGSVVGAIGKAAGAVVETTAQGLAEDVQLGAEIVGGATGIVQGANLSKREATLRANAKARGLVDFQELQQVNRIRVRLGLPKLTAQQIIEGK
jgi:hypothetical protein